MFGLIEEISTIYSIDYNNESAQLSTFFVHKDTFNKLGYKAKINTHTTSYIN